MPSCPDHFMMHFLSFWGFTSPVTFIMEKRCKTRWVNYDTILIFRWILPLKWSSRCFSGYILCYTPVLKSRYVCFSLMSLTNKLCTGKYKKWIQREYEYVTEYNSLPGEYVLLSERYTQPLIIMRHREKREREEEMCSVGGSFQQLISRNNADKDSSILDALFSVDNKGISPCSVILQGNSGNGKSFTAQKIMLDWASGNLHREEFDCLFHLKCKELNQISGEQSLAELLSHNTNLTSDQISQILQKAPEKVLILIDGFDELKFSYSDTSNMSKLSHVSEKAPPEASLTAVLRGQILSESFLLVTTRSTATKTLGGLLKHPQRFTEIIGFSEKEVEEYFQRFFQNEELFRKAFECVKANETLITACSIPVICWIICTVMRERFSDGADVTSGLETTTSIYVDFVSTLLEHHCQGLSQSVPILLSSLGQLAERGMLEKQKAAVWREKCAWNCFKSCWQSVPVQVPL